MDPNASVWPMFVFDAAIVLFWIVAYRRRQKVLYRLHYLFRPSRPRGLKKVAKDLLSLLFCLALFSGPLAELTGILGP